MRLLHILDRTDAVGGVQTYLAQLVPALDARGIESSFVAADGPASFAGAPVVRVAGLDADGARLRAETRRALDEELRRAAPDVVYLHVGSSPELAVVAARHAPVVAYAHDYGMVCPGNARYLHRSGRFCDEGVGLRCFWRAYTERSTNRRPDRLTRAYLRARAWPEAWPSVARVLVASPFVADVLAADGVPREKLCVVAYPVETPPVVEPEPLADVLYVGRVVASKGVSVLLRAVAGLDGTKLAVAGDGPERPRLEAQAEALGVDARFLGWVDPDRRAALLRGARVFAMPSLWAEPFGIVGVEALAAGLPVVASAVGGVPSWLEDGRGGLLVPPRDVDALRSALHRVLAEPGLAERLTAAGPEAAGRFSLEAHLELLLPELEAVA